MTLIHSRLNTVSLLHSTLSWCNEQRPNPCDCMQTARVNRPLGWEASKPGRECYLNATAYWHTHPYNQHLLANWQPNNLKLHSTYQRIKYLCSMMPRMRHTSQKGMLLLSKVRVSAKHYQKTATAQSEHMVRGARHPRQGQTKRQRATCHGSGTHDGNRQGVNGSSLTCVSQQPVGDWGWQPQSQLLINRSTSQLQPHSCPTGMYVAIYYGCACAQGATTCMDARSCCWHLRKTPITNQTSLRKTWALLRPVYPMRP